MLEFGVPRRIWRAPWELYVRIGLPLAGRAISPGWHEVASSVPASATSTRAIRSRNCSISGATRGSRTFAFAD